MAAVDSHLLARRKRMEKERQRERERQRRAKNAVGKVAPNPRTNNFRINNIFCMKNVIIDWKYIRLEIKRMIDFISKFFGLMIGPTCILTKYVSQKAFNVLMLVFSLFSVLFVQLLCYMGNFNAVKKNPNSFSYKRNPQSIFFKIGGDITKAINSSTVLLGSLFILFLSSILIFQGLSYSFYQESFNPIITLVFVVLTSIPLILYFSRFKKAFFDLLPHLNFLIIVLFIFSCLLYKNTVPNSAFERPISMSFAVFGFLMCLPIYALISWQKSTFNNAKAALNSPSTILFSLFICIVLLLIIGNMTYYSGIFISWAYPLRDLHGDGIMPGTNPNPFWPPSAIIKMLFGFFLFFNVLGNYNVIKTQGIELVKDLFFLAYDSYFTLTITFIIAIAFAGIFGILYRYYSVFEILNIIIVKVLFPLISFSIPIMFLLAKFYSISKVFQVIMVISVAFVIINLLFIGYWPSWYNPFDLLSHFYNFVLFALKGTVKVFA